MSVHLSHLFDLAGDAGALLKKRGETIAVAESSSGGLVSASLLSVPGASSYFLGGGTIYTRVARDALLGLPEEVVAMRASTEDYALLVAEAVRKKLGATWGLCESGASGPTRNSYDDAAGHVVVALSGPRKLSRTVETGSDDREGNMWRFAGEALNLLQEGLAGT